MRDDEQPKSTRDRELAKAHQPAESGAPVGGPPDTTSDQLELFGVTSSITHVGPLPQPEQLAAYERVGEGTADRIIKMAEAEQKHRHDMNSTFMAEARRGQRYATGLIALAIVGGSCVAALGHWAGATIVGLVVGGVGAVSWLQIRQKK